MEAVCGENKPYIEPEVITMNHNYFYKTAVQNFEEFQKSDYTLHLSHLRKLQEVGSIN